MTKKTPMVKKKGADRKKKAAILSKIPKKTKSWAEMTSAQRKLMIRKGCIDHEALANYWREHPATTKAVTGDNEDKSAKDLDKSRPFIKELLPAEKEGFERVLDAGAGIGRVTNGLLRQHASHVDLLEPAKKLLDKAKATLGAKKKECTFGYFNLAMQKFEPCRARRYDLVFGQWVFMYMCDVEVVDFLKKAKASLSSANGGGDGGLIVVKENVTDPGQRSHLDDADENMVTPSSLKPPISVVRSDAHHRKIFKQAGLKVFKEREQKGGPKPGNDNHVMCYALRPL